MTIIEVGNGSKRKKKTKNARNSANKSKELIIITPYNNHCQLFAARSVHFVYDFVIASINMVKYIYLQLSRHVWHIGLFHLNS